MPSLSKASILKTVRHHINTNILRRFLKDQIGPKTTAKTMEDALGHLDANLSKDEIQSFLFDHIHTMKHHTYVFETDALQAFDATRVNGRLRGAIPAFDAEKVVVIRHEVASSSIYGYAVTTVNAQVANPNGGYTGTARELEALVPFKVQFHGTTHAKLKISKFAPAYFEDTQGGTLEVLDNHFKEEDFAKYVLAEIISHYSDETFIRSNLTTGVKNLVRALRLGTMIARAQEPNGQAIEQRTMNRIAGRPLMVEQTWYVAWFYNSPWIGSSKWFWLETGSPNPTETRDLDSHTIDAELGKISQDAFSEDDLEGLIDEVVANNA